MNLLSSVAHLRKEATFCALALGLSLLVGAANCRADVDMTWTNGSDVWQSPTAWTTNLCDIASNCAAGGTGGWPGQGTPFEDAWFTNAATYYVKLNGNITISTNAFRNNNFTEATVTLDMGVSSILDVTTFVDIGDQANSTTTVYLASNNQPGYQLGGGSVTIGRNGIGTLIITNGIFSAAAETVSLGTGGGGQGHLIISGPTSHLDCNGLSIGNATNSLAGSSLVLTNGGSLKDTSSFRLGSGSGSASSNATLVVCAGSLLTLDSGPETIGCRTSGTNQLCVGNTLTVLSGAVVQAGIATKRSMVIGDCYIIDPSKSVAGNTATGNVLNIMAGGIVTNVGQLTITATNTLNLLGGYLAASSITNLGLMVAYGAHLGSELITTGGVLQTRNSLGSFAVTNNFILDAGGSMQIELGTSFFSTTIGLSQSSNNSFRVAGKLNFTDSGGFAPGVYTLITFPTNALGFGGTGVVYAATTATIGTVPNPSFTYTLDTNTFGMIKLVVTGPAATGPFQIISNARSGNDIVLKWTATNIGVTNHVQATGGTANGSYTNNFADLFVINGVATITNTYTDAGGATNKPSRYYRIVQTP